MQRLLLSIIFSLLLPTIAGAQFLLVEGAFVPSSSFHKKSGETVEDSETNFKTASIVTAMPFYFSRDSINQTFSVWMGVLNASYTTLAFDNVPEEYPDEIFRGILLINNIQKLKGNNYLSASFGAGVMGEREHLNPNTFLFMAGLNYYKIFWKKLEIGGGLFVTNMFGSIFIFPMPHFKFTIGEKLSFRFDQSESSLKYKFNEIFSLSILYGGRGTLSLVQRRNEEDKREKKIFQASQQIFGIKPELQFKKGKYGISAIIGQAYNRNYRLIDRKFIRFFNSMFQSTPHTEEELYLSLQLRYRFF